MNPISSATGQLNLVSSRLSNPKGQIFGGGKTDFLLDGTSLTGFTFIDAPYLEKRRPSS